MQRRDSKVKAGEVREGGAAARLNALFGAKT